MAALSLHNFNHLVSILSSPSSSSFWNLSFSFKNEVRFKKGKFLVFLSTHSNPKILKSNKKSRFGQRITSYDTDEEQEEDEDEEFDDNDDGMAGDDWLMNDDFAQPHEYVVNGKKIKSHKGSGKEGNRRLQEQRKGSKALKSRQGLIISEDQMDVRHGNDGLKRKSVGNSYHTSTKTKEAGSFDVDGGRMLVSKTSRENRYQRLSDEIDLDEKWFPLLDYLSTFGLKDTHFIQMYERHMPSLQINVCSAQERLDYLLSVGVKQRDVRRILLRQPQILEYTVENNLKSHVAFLMSLGIPSSRIGQIIACAPSLFSYSVENSLKPTVRYLIEEELGAPRDSIVKMVKKHPQLLHYSIDDGLLPRINFLRSIGMRNSDILKVLTSLTQVLSLSLEDNLKPKYLYLINELNNEADILTVIKRRIPETSCSYPGDTCRDFPFLFTFY
ncbi:hypothetical protein V6Z12_D13G161700 [Gossypium hirsutum]